MIRAPAGRGGRRVQAGGSGSIGAGEAYIHGYWHSPDLAAVTRLFVAGREDVGPGDSRAAPVIQRVLDLSEAQVEAERMLLAERAHFNGPGLFDD